MRESQEAARAKGVQLLVLKAGTESEIDAAFATLVQLHAGALVVRLRSVLHSRREQLVALAARHAVPAIYRVARVRCCRRPDQLWTEPHRRLSPRSAFMRKILKGAKPADLPVQQPTTFELVVNLKTAKALGLTVPPSILARATEVIE